MVAIMAVMPFGHMAANPVSDFFQREHKVALSMNNSTVATLAKAISSQTGIAFSYSDEVGALRMGSVRYFRDAVNVQQLIDEVFDHELVSPEIRGEIVVLNPVGKPEVAPAPSPAGAAQQAEPVRGRVTDAATGEPLAGVSVLLRGNNRIYAVTGGDGSFSINAPSDGVLSFDLLGYVPVELSIAGRNNLAVRMEADAEMLEEVVMIGYGTVRKSDLTGSVSSVKSEDIMKRPTYDVVQALQGQVAGFDITRGSGDADTPTTLNIRGTRTIYGSNSPLFIIDGMEGSYDQVNPADIESIEVLKDASSTAIYGSAGANGVVIITTKTARKDKFSVNVDAYHGFNAVTSFPEIATGEDFINVRRESLRAVGKWNSTADDGILFEPAVQKAIDNNQWINWFKELTQIGNTDNYNISTSYANDKVNSYFSVGYYGLEGALKNDRVKRYTMRAKIDVKPADFINYGVNIYANFRNNDARNTRPWNRILCTLPLGVPYNEDGSVKNEFMEGYTGDNPSNPLADINEGQYVNNTKSISVTPQMYVELHPLKGLSFKSVFGAFLLGSKNGTYTGPYSYSGYVVGGNGSTKNTSASSTDTRRYNYKWQNILTYDFDIAGDHHFTLTGLTEWSHKQYETFKATGTNYESSYLYHNLGAFSGTASISSDYIGSQMMSFAGRVNYSYLGRYIFSASGRYDGASILAEGHKWDFFPSAAAAWRISEEPWFNSEKVNNLKLRLSYGVTGNAGASEYATISSTRTGYYGMQEVFTTYSGYSQNVANPNLTWEKSRMFDVGLDAGFFKDRLTLEVDYYRTKTTGLLFQAALPYGQGGYNESSFIMWDNIGSTQNNGIEITLHSENIATRDFSWGTTLTFAKNNEKIIETSQDGPLKFGKRYYLIPGYPRNTFWTYKYTGIWGTDEAEEAAKYGRKPGEIKIEDVDNGNGKDYKYNQDDYQVLGSETPAWTGSLLNNFVWKNFDLSFLIIARWDWMTFNGITGWYRQNGILPIPKMCDYWTPENQDAHFPRPQDGLKQDTYQEASNLMDASYIKMQNLQVGYSFPSRWLDRARISRARIYATVTDPIVWTRCKYFKDYDIEKGGNDDYSPLSKQLVFGINVTF